MPSPFTPAEPLGACVAHFRRGGSLPRKSGGSASALEFSRPPRRSLDYGLLARGITFMTLCIVGSDSFVTSAIAAIATGWSDPLPGGTDSHWETMPSHGAQTFTSSINAMPGTQSKWRHAMRGAMIKGRKLLPDSIADRWTPAAIITAAADVLAKAVIPAAATDIVALARSAIAAGTNGVIAWSRVGTGNSKP
jgi:hypothetical protein